MDPALLKSLEVISITFMLELLNFDPNGESIISIDLFSLKFPEFFEHSNPNLEIESRFENNEQLTISLYNLTESGTRLHYQTGQEFDASDKKKTETLAISVSGQGLFRLIVTNALGFELWSSFHWKKSANLTDPSDLQEIADEIYEAQNQYINFEYREDGYTGSNSFKVHVLLADCKVERERQIVKGGFVDQTRFGMDNESSLSVARKYLHAKDLPSGFELPEKSEEIALGEHPITAVIFNNVAASKPNNILSTLRGPITNIIRALSLERGASPKPINYYCLPQDGGSAILLFPSSIYRGIHGGGFGSSPLSDLLENIENAQKNDPWIEFGLALYSETKVDEVRYQKLFKAWSLLESAAKRKIPRSNTEVNDEDGKPIKIGGKKLTLERDLGRTLQYLQDKVYSNTTIHDGRPWSFSRQVCLAYKVRNIVAHEGGADLSVRVGSNSEEIEALKFYDQSNNIGYGALAVQDWAQATIQYEIGLHREAGWKD